MVDPPVHVAAIIRHGGALLACSRAREQPALPTRSVEGTGSLESALDDLLDALDVIDPSVERWGEPVETSDAPLRPVLVSVERREAGVAPECPEPVWITPADLRDEGDDSWWQAYRTVAPSVETVRTDDERGSTAIATDALWTLRDAAIDADATGGGPGIVDGTARALLEARPGMAAVATRIDRVMADATSPSEAVAGATAGLERAAAADKTAASLAAETVDDSPVLTLSRSGTVRAALLMVRPPVVVCASRPGGEGEAVAAELETAGLDVERCEDGDVYARLRAGDVEAVLVGADAVTPGGALINKVGTWAVALAARWVDVPTYAVCASDKIMSAASSARRPPFEPLFDLTPPAYVSAVLTERGQLGTEEVRTVAEEHRELGSWRR